MQSYKAPVNDMKFILKDFLNSGASDFLFKDNEFELEDLNFIIDESSKFCEDILLPLNQSGDEEGCKFNNGKVTTPKGFKEAYSKFVENGWQGATLDQNYGGQGLPYIINVLFDEMTVDEHLWFYARLKGKSPPPLTKDRG